MKSPTNQAQPTPQELIASHPHRLVILSRDMDWHGYNIVELSGVHVDAADRSTRLEDHNEKYIDLSSSNEILINSLEIGTALRQIAQGSQPTLRTVLSPVQIMRNPLMLEIQDTAQRSLSELTVQDCLWTASHLRQSVRRNIDNAPARTAVSAYHIMAMAISLREQGRLEQTKLAQGEVKNMPLAREIEERIARGEHHLSPAEKDTFDREFDRLLRRAEQALERKVLPDTPPNVPELKDILARARQQE